MLFWMILLFWIILVFLSDVSSWDGGWFPVLDGCSFWFSFPVQTRTNTLYEGRPIMGGSYYPTIHPRLLATHSSNIALLKRVLQPTSTLDSLPLIPSPSNNQSTNMTGLSSDSILSEPHQTNITTDQLLSARSNILLNLFPFINITSTIIQSSVQANHTTMSSLRLNRVSEALHSLPASVLLAFASSNPLSIVQCAHNEVAVSLYQCALPISEVKDEPITGNCFGTAIYDHRNGRCFTLSETEAILSCPTGYRISLLPGDFFYRSCRPSEKVLAKPTCDPPYILMNHDTCSYNVTSAGYIGCTRGAYRYPGTDQCAITRKSRRKVVKCPEGWSPQLGMNGRGTCTKKHTVRGQYFGKAYCPVGARPSLDYLRVDVNGRPTVQCEKTISIDAELVCPNSTTPLRDPIFGTHSLCAAEQNVTVSPMCRDPKAKPMWAQPGLHSSSKLRVPIVEVEKALNKSWGNLTEWQYLNGELSKTGNGGSELREVQESPPTTDPAIDVTYTAANVSSRLSTSPQDAVVGGSTGRNNQRSSDPTDFYKKHVSRRLGFTLTGETQVNGFKKAYPIGWSSDVDLSPAYPITYRESRGVAEPGTLVYSSGSGQQLVVLCIRPVTAKPTLKCEMGFNPSPSDPSECRRKGYKNLVLKCPERYTLNKASLVYQAGHGYHKPKAKCIGKLAAQTDYSCISTTKWSNKVLTPSMIFSSDQVFNSVFNNYPRPRSKEMYEALYPPHPIRLPDPTHLRCTSVELRPPRFTASLDAVETLFPAYLELLRESAVQFPGATKLPLRIQPFPGNNSTQGEPTSSP